MVKTRLQATRKSDQEEGTSPPSPERRRARSPATARTAAEDKRRVNAGSSGSKEKESRTRSPGPPRRPRVPRKPLSPHDRPGPQKSPATSPRPATDKSGAQAKRPPPPRATPPRPAARRAGLCTRIARTLLLVLVPALVAAALHRPARDQLVRLIASISGGEWPGVPETTPGGCVAEIDPPGLAGAFGGGEAAEELADLIAAHRERAQSGVVHAKATTVAIWSRVGGRSGRAARDAGTAVVAEGVTFEPRGCARECTLVVDGGEYLGERAASHLQSDLVLGVLARCQRPVVLVRDVLAMAPRALFGPLHTLTSEGGVFHHEGRPYEAGRALVFLTADGLDTRGQAADLSRQGLGRREARTALQRALREVELLEGKAAALVDRVDFFAEVPGS